VNIKFVKPVPLTISPEPPLSDRELVDYLSKRAYVECTDQGNDDPKQFYNPGMYGGNFRQALSTHIRKVGK
jgi:hypothetical protein